MPEPGTDLASGRRWWCVRPELVVVIALQVAGAGAGVAAALAAGGGGPARGGRRYRRWRGRLAGGRGEVAGAGSAVALVLAVPVAVWWLIGDRYSSSVSFPGYPGWVIRPFPVSPAAERAVGRGSVLVAIAAATWLAWASLRHDFDLRWWSVLGPLLPAGILAGFGWRMLTARVPGGNFGAGCAIIFVGPVVAGLLGWAVTRSLIVL